MRKRFLAAVSLVSTLVAALTSLAHASDARACTLQPLGSIDLRALDSGRLYVPVTIENVNALLTLNLADAYSSINQSAVEELGLPLGPMPRGASITLGKATITNYAVVSSLSSGTLRFGKVKFLIVPESSEEVRDIKPDEIIGRMGFDVFGHVDVELDLANRKMTLYSQDHCPGRVVYWAAKYDAVALRHSPLGTLYFPMKLDGKLSKRPSAAAS